MYYKNAFLSMNEKTIMAFIILIAILIIWSAIWKLIALWKAARNNSKAWYIVLAILNTLGILEILYIFIFSKKNKNRRHVTVRRRSSRRNQRR